MKILLLLLLLLLLITFLYLYLASFMINTDYFSLQSINKINHEHTKNKNKNITILIVHYDSRKDSRMRDKSFPNHIKYATFNNYSVFMPLKKIYPFSYNAWVKIPLLLDALSTLEYSNSPVNCT